MIPNPSFRSPQFPQTILRQLHAFHKPKLSAEPFPLPEPPTRLVEIPRPAGELAQIDHGDGAPMIAFRRATGGILDGVGEGDRFAGPLRGVVDHDGVGGGSHGRAGRRVLEQQRDGEVVHYFARKTESFLLVGKSQSPGGGSGVGLQSKEEMVERSRSRGGEGRGKLLRTTEWQLDWGRRLRACKKRGAAR